MNSMEFSDSRAVGRNGGFQAATADIVHGPSGQAWLEVRSKRMAEVAPILLVLCPADRRKLARLLSEEV